MPAMVACCTSRRFCACYKAITPRGLLKKRLAPDDGPYKSLWEGADAGSEAMPLRVQNGSMIFRHREPEIAKMEIGFTFGK
jgi:hypothetical protein